MGFQVTEALQPTSRNTLAIIQARMSSSRLPGKVLLDLAGQPMLVRVVERTQRAKTVNSVVVATTDDPSDDPIAQVCTEHGYACFRGSLHDVLDRYYQAARTFGAEIIVRITADCPVIDPDVVDATVEAFLGNPTSHQSSVISHQPVNSRPLITGNCSLFTDYCSNRLPPPWSRTFPIGLDVEVCSFAALQRAWEEADQPFHREHVMPYFYEGLPAEALQPSQNMQHATLDSCFVFRAISPRGFRVAQLHHHPDYGNLRWTVDTPADLELLRRVYQHFGGRDDFSWLSVRALFEQHPDLAEINAAVPHKTAFAVDERISRA
jgi:spore coat polysaccharide biosynthesis protein SpsF